MTKWRSFSDAKMFVKELQLNSEKEWRTYCKSNKKPNDIPSNPNVAYKKWNIDRRKRRNEKV